MYDSIVAARPRSDPRATSPISAFRSREMCNDEFREPRERILMKNIAYAGALVAHARHRHGRDRAAAHRAVRRQGPAARVRTSARSGSATISRPRISSTRCPATSRRWTQPEDRSSSTATPPRRSAACMPARRLRPGTRSRRQRRSWTPLPSTAPSSGTTPRPGATTTWCCRPRTSWPPSAWSSARRGRERARSRRRRARASR